MSASNNRILVASSELVSEFMAAQRTRDTKPETAIRSALHRRGVRFRLHKGELPGRPDVALVRIHVAVFVDGCFWHSCPEHGTYPKANADWWRVKLEKTVIRDRRIDAELRGLGWEPVHVWEHEDPEVAADSLAARWFA
jgi:DNA mismatch endonuclease (patch repair protein)